MNLLRRLASVIFQKPATRCIDCQATVREASRQGLSVCEYVEKLWDQQGCTARVIAEILAHKDAATAIERTLEVGPGTGRYLEMVREVSPGAVHEIYELADDWAAYLSALPGVVRRKCDGSSLSVTPSSSIDLCHAHGVFVYTPFLVTASYIREMARVCRSNGVVAFDVYSLESFRDHHLDAWLASPHRYPCYVGSDIILEIARTAGLSLVHRFLNKHGASRSEYFLFHKQDPSMSSSQ